MNLHKATKDEYKVISQLYRTAFPRNERFPFFLLKRRAVQNRSEMIVAKDKDEFIGFAYTCSYKDLVYLFYFAIVEDKRECGNGTEIIRLLKNYYEGKKNVFI